MIILYRGSRGKGKTLTMVKDALKFYQLGYDVYSNLNLKFGMYIPSSDVIGLDNFSNLKNCVLVIDEIELFFDSRMFKNKDNINFSKFLQQIRKRNIIILCTAQYVNLIDLRIRQQLDIVAYPRFNKKNNLCSVQYFNLTQIEDNFYNNQLFPSFIVYDCLPVFHLYNTYEMLS